MLSVEWAEDGQSRRSFNLQHPTFRVLASSRDTSPTFNFCRANINASFADYADYHRTKGNKWFHRFGIPMIMLGLIGLLARVGATVGHIRIDLAMVLIAASTIYYLVLEWRLAIAMLVVSVGLYFAGVWLPSVRCRSIGRRNRFNV